MVYKPAVNDFIQFTGKDEQGRYTQIGRVLEVKDDNIIFGTEFGVISQPLDEGKYRKISKPRGFKISEPRQKSESTGLVAKKKQPRRLAGPSKYDLCLESIKKYMDEFGEFPVRKTGIEWLVRQCDMTPAGASTYYAKIKKVLI